MGNMLPAHTATGFSTVCVLNIGETIVYLSLLVYVRNMDDSVPFVGCV